VSDAVVIGDESADSEFCVEVLSLCLCEPSADSPCGWSCVCVSATAILACAISISLGSTTVTVLSSITSSSTSNTDMNEGNWSSYIRRAAAEGMLMDASGKALLEPNVPIDGTEVA
jgi:hypothetical protein